MKVLVIGANGKTGTHVVRRLADSGHDPVAAIRNPDQRPKFDALGVPTALADLEYPIDHAMQGCDAVIFAAGSGAHTGKDKTVLVDHIGAIRSMVTAQLHGARRYVMLSSFRANVNSQSRIAHYHRAKAHADHHLMTSDLDWTVVCPGRLTDDPGSGTVTVSTDFTIDGTETTSRENLAAVLVRCLDALNTVGKRFCLFEGDTPILEALAAV